MDGNKRIAFAATDVFLRIDGFRIVGASLGLHREFIHMLETRAFDFAHFEPWLRARTRPLG